MKKITVKIGVWVCFGIGIINERSVVDFELGCNYGFGRIMVRNGLNEISLNICMILISLRIDFWSAVYWNREIE